MRNQYIQGDSWYDTQTLEWDKLEAKGWKFSKPVTSATLRSINLIMSKDDIEIKISFKHREFRRTHTQMLDTCKAVADVLGS